MQGQEKSIRLYLGCREFELESTISHRKCKRGRRGLVGQTLKHAYRLHPSSITLRRSETPFLERDDMLRSIVYRVRFILIFIGISNFGYVKLPTPSSSDPCILAIRRTYYRLLHPERPYSAWPAWPAWPAVSCAGRRPGCSVPIQPSTGLMQSTMVALVGNGGRERITAPASRHCGAACPLGPDVFVSLGSLAYLTTCGRFLSVTHVSRRWWLEEIGPS